jgi:hypothetical protein
MFQPRVFGLCTPEAGVCRAAMAGDGLASPALTRIAQPQPTVPVTRRPAASAAISSPPRAVTLQYAGPGPRGMP